MGKNRLEVTFNAILTSGDVVDFSYKIGTTIKKISIKWIRRDRAIFTNGNQYPADENNNTYIHHGYLGFGEGANEIVQKNDSPFPLNNYDAQNYYQKISALDTLNYFGLEQTGDKVIIHSRVDGLEFLNYSSNNNNVTFNYIIDTSTTLEVFAFDYVKIISGDCNEVTYEARTSINTVSVEHPFKKTVNSKIFTFKYLRGNTIDLTVKDTHGRIETKKIHTPIQLLNSNIFTSIIGNTLTVNYNSLTPLRNQVLKYSIDGTNFNSSNVFTINYGNITVYVRDKFGCTVSKDFTFIDNSKKIPYFFVSKTNSIRLKKIENWDYKNVYKTDENTLSCEVLDDVPNTDIQRWQTNDIITTQIRTNYDNVQAFILTKTNEISLPVNQVRTFLNVNDSRDGFLLKRNGKTIVFFNKGNKYDYTTGNKIGEYELNGSKPYWMRTGTNIHIEGVGDFKITRSYFDEIMSFEVIEINYDYDGDFEVKKIKTNYSIHPFNVFEFNSDFSNLENQSIRIKIIATDNKMNTVNLISEEVVIKKKHKNCLEIIYYNDKNGDILYETGIKHKLRIPFEKITDNPISEIEIHKGDTQVSITKAEYYEGDIIEFSPLSKELSKKLEYALLHNFLTINGVAYCSNEPPEKEKLENSNLYIVKAKLIKAGGQSYINSSVLDVEETANVEIPKLIHNGQDGFISY